MAYTFLELVSEPQIKEPKDKKWKNEGIGQSAHLKQGLANEDLPLTWARFPDNLGTIDLS